MARAMYYYTLEVLQKVSFSSTLFCNELQKAKERLLPFEYEELMIWLKSFIINNPKLGLSVSGFYRPSKCQD